MRSQNIRRESDPYAALRIPEFRRFLAGMLLVQLGTSAQAVALGWQLYSRTGEPLALAWQGLVEAVPMLLLTLPAGYLADVVDRRKLVFAGLSAATLTSVALALSSTGTTSIGLIYLFLFLDASALRFAGPATVALTPLLVPNHAFENAIRWRTALFQTSALVGPALGGFLVAVGPSHAYWFSASASLTFALIVLSVRPREEARARPGPMLERIREGLRYVRNNQLVLSTLSLDLFAVLLGGAVYLLPVFARDIIRLEGTGLSPERALGWLRAAPAAGALFMSALLTYLPPFRRAGRTMLLSVAGFGLATVGFGLTQNLWIALLMLACTGALDNVSVVIRHTLVQLATPNHLRGRVSAVNSVFIGSSNQLGGFESGLVAHWFGPVVSVVAGGLGTLGVVVTWSLAFPQLRRLRSLEEVQKREAQEPLSEGEPERG